MDVNLDELSKFITFQVKFEHKIMGERYFTQISSRKCKLSDIEPGLKLSDYKKE